MPCGIDGCTNMVTWEYNPGEPMTRNHPSEPAMWIPNGCEVTKQIPIRWNVLTTSRHPLQETIKVTHCEILAGDDNACQRVESALAESFEDLWLWW